nr:integrase, catalytic region, zinc finger, CCHC-type, peptidase aspartic, catalytic [Tanacetum cinerariifolium]
MSSNFDDIQAASSDTRPPMLDKTDYDSWSQRNRLYCKGKENGIYIILSIDHGPFELGTTRDTLGTTPERGVLLKPERPCMYDDLNEYEKKRFDADFRATNIVLHGLPKDIYKLINHNIKAKAIWDNVKMLLAGSELTKEDRKSQLYDDFKRFKMLPGENINEYYVRFYKLVNDMRNIRMTMPNIQLNSNHYNSTLNTPKLMKSLTLSPNKSHYLPNHSEQLSLRQTTNFEPLLTPKTKQQFRMVGSWFRMFKGDRIRLRGTLLIGMVQLAIRKHKPVLGMSMQDKMLLMQAQENGAVLNEEELLFLTGEQTNNFDADVDDHPVRDLALNDDNIFQADECDAFGSDVDNEPTAQSIFMANLSSAGPTNQLTGPSNASTLSEVHDLENAIDLFAMNRVVELEDENSKLLKKIKNDDHDTMFNSFLKLEVAHLNLQLKHQHLKENIENFKSKSPKDVLEFDAFFKLGKRDDQIQVHKNTIRKLKAQISQLKANKSDDISNLDYKSPDSQNLQLKETITTLQKRLQNYKSKNEKVKLHYQELFTSIKITSVQTIDKTTYLQNEIENLKTQLKEKMPCITSNDATPKVHACAKYEIDVQPIPPHQRNNRVVHHDYLNRLRDTVDILCEIVEKARNKRPSNNNLDYACIYTKRSQKLLENMSALCPKADNKRDTIIATTPTTSKKTLPVNSIPKKNIKYHHMKSKSKLSKKSRVDLSSSVRRTVFNTNSNSLCKTCYSKHMTGDRSRLKNFMKKFIETVRFRNGHFGEIMGYEDYLLGDNVISRVYYVEGLGHNLFSVGSHGSNLYTISVEDMMRSSTICLLSKASKNKSWLWHYRLNHLNFGTINDLAWKDLVRRLPSEDLGKLKAKADIGLFVGYAPNRKGYQIYNKRTRQIMETIHVTFNELTRQTVLVQTSPGLAPNLLMTRPISSGLVPNLAPAIPYVPPTKKELKILFKPMFDEYFEPSTVDQQVLLTFAIHIPVNPPCISVSISVDQDVPSEGHSPSSLDHQSSSAHHGVTADYSLEVNPFTLADNELALKYHHPRNFDS